MGNWLGGPNQAAIEWERKTVGQKKAYITGGTGTDVLHSKSKRLTVNHQSLLDRLLDRLLDAAHAKKVFERKQMRQQRNGTPTKSTVPSRELSSSKQGNKSSISNRKSSKIIEQKGKRKREYSSDDVDFIAKPVKRKLKP